MSAGVFPTFISATEFVHGIFDNNDTNNFLRQLLSDYNNLTIIIHLSNQKEM